MASKPEYIHAFSDSDISLDKYLLAIFRIYISMSSIFSEMPSNYTRDGDILRYYFYYIIKHDNPRYTQAEFDNYFLSTSIIYTKLINLNIGTDIQSILAIEPHLGVDPRSPIGGPISYPLHIVLPDQSVFDRLGQRGGRNTKRKSKKRKRSSSSKLKKHNSKNKRRKL
jgi:hypothetical protein